MKKRTKSIVAFAVVLVVGLLGLTIGVRLGIESGRADYHNQYVRELQSDLGDAAQTSDPHTQRVLGLVSDLVAAMGQPERFRKAHEVFTQGIKEMPEAAASDSGKPAN